MKISTRTRYGARAIIEMAACYDKGVVSLKDISSNQNIPLGYLSKIMFALKKAGIVKTARGKGGGFVLARAPHEISVADIFNELEGPIAPKECERMCKRRQACTTVNVWQGLENNIKEYLKAIKISGLIKNKIELKKSAWI